MLSVQMAWGERIVAAAAGCDGDEDKKCQLCACSSCSAIHKKGRVNPAIKLYPILSSCVHQNRNIPFTLTYIASFTILIIET